MLAGGTGMRPNSELFPLEWANVHTECTQDAPDSIEIRDSVRKEDCLQPLLLLNGRAVQSEGARKKEAKKSGGPEPTASLVQLQKLIRSDNCWMRG